MKRNYLAFASLLIIGFSLWGFTTMTVASSLGQANIFDNFFNRFFGAPVTPPTAGPKTAAPQYESKIDYEEAVISAVDKTSPAVVAITISKNVPIIENCPIDPFSNVPPEFRQFFGNDNLQFTQPCQKGSQLQDIGGGSGFIISSDGLVLTNKHVVADSEASYTVFTTDGKKYDATVLARDSVQDLAVLKIKATGLAVATLGNSDTIRLGQTAISIGNALGEFRNTVSVGVVSGLARNITAGGGAGGGSEDLEGVIQTDAAINPGNSGGPLVNLRGEVIGINTAIVSGAQNIGFALPINIAKRDIESVKRTGKIVVPFIGVRYLVVTPELAKKEKLKSETGALVRGSDDGPAVIKDSPAAKAGLKAEDIILEVNGLKITPEHSLFSLVQKYSVGDTVNLTVLRDGKNLTIPITLEERK